MSTLYLHTRRKTASLALAIGLVLVLNTPNHTFADTRNEPVAFTNLSSNSFTGIQASWSNPNYQTSNNQCQSGAHVNQTIWLNTQGTSFFVPTASQRWAEIGFTYGYHGQCADLYYWAYQNDAGYVDGTIGTAGVGASHTFKIIHSSSSAWWDLYIDNTVYKTAPTSGPSNWGREGLEDYYFSTPGHAPSASVSYMQWRDNTTQSWHNWAVGVTSAGTAPNPFPSGYIWYIACSDLSCGFNSGNS